MKLKSIPTFILAVLIVGWPFLAMSQSTLCPSAPPNSLRYVLSAQRSEIQSGENLIVNLTIQNVSSQSVPFWVENAEDQGGLHYQFEVKDEQMKTPPDGHFTKAMKGINDEKYRTKETPMHRSGGCIELQPNETRTFMMDIGRLYDLTSPQKYSIVAIEKQATGKVVLLSNTINVTVLPNH